MSLRTDSPYDPDSQGGPGGPGDSGTYYGPDGAGPASEGRHWPGLTTLGLLTGIAAGVLALGLAEIVAGLISPASSPLIALGDAFVDHTPRWLKEFATSTFGTHDKTVLLTGAVLTAVLLAAVAGVIAVRGRVIVGIYLVLGLGAVAAFAAFTRPDATPLSVLPSVVGAIAGMVTIQRLAPIARNAALPPFAGEAHELARRQVLQGGGGVVAAGLLSELVGRQLGSRLRGADQSRAAVVLPKPASPAPALPAGADLKINGLSSFFTSNDDFYRIDTALVVPRLTTAKWSLRIHGMVDREVSITYEQLLASELVERDITLMCVSNYIGGDLTSNARWLGLPIRGLLEQAGVSSDATMVLSTSSDGFTAGTPLDVLMDSGRDCLLAVGMNGQPLPIEHGFPVRMVVPGLYGYVSATKWVVDLKVTTFDDDQGYWVPRGWSATAPVKVGSRIDVPGDNQSVKQGTVALAGIAWAEHRGIKGVQVQLDNGSWMDAELAAEDTKDTWRQWVYRWDASTPGDHQWRVRAITADDGEVQTGKITDPAPDGATGWHTIKVHVNG